MYGVAAFADDSRVRLVLILIAGLILVGAVVWQMLGFDLDLTLLLPGAEQRTV